jgi:DNA-binding transcriptional regulator GbsR (MarR family)
MEMQESKNQFIALWGTLGSQWGINRSMAQVHALLLTSKEALSTEDVMEKLSISRGNANTNLRDLLSWNLIYKQIVPGDRKEYFKAEKEVWEIAKRIAKERRRREVEPLIQQLVQLEQSIESDSEDKDFILLIHDLKHVINRMDQAIDLLMKIDDNKYLSVLTKLIK